MARTRLLAAAIATVGVVLIAGYALLWGGVSRSDIGRSDFTATYVGATLLREGRGATMYDEAVQAPVHAAVVAPLGSGDLAFVNPPPAALLALPLTLLPLDGAYRLWQVLQLAMLAAAVAVAMRAAPWPAGMRRGGVPAATAVVALAGTGTLGLGLLGQWDGLSALGLAGAYALWRRDRGAAGGAVLAVSSLVAKPHLAIGLAALLLGWRDRRVLLGAVAGGMTTLAVSLAAVGPSGLTGFAGGVYADARRWPLSSMLGFTGLSGSWLGEGAAAQVVAGCASVVAVAGCVVVGRHLATRRHALEPCLAAATLLSLLASPHLLGHDLVLLAPVLVALLGWAAGRDGRSAWPGRRSAAVLGGWMALSLAAALDLGAHSPTPPGRLVPWVLLILAGLLTRELMGGGRSLPSGRPALVARGGRS